MTFMRPSMVRWLQGDVPQRWYDMIWTRTLRRTATEPHMFP